MPRGVGFRRVVAGAGAGVPTSPYSLIQKYLGYFQKGLVMRGAGSWARIILVRAWILGRG